MTQQQMQKSRHIAVGEGRLVRTLPKYNLGTLALDIAAGQDVAEGRLLLPAGGDGHARHGAVQVAYPQDPCGGLGCTSRRRRGSLSKQK